MPDIDPTDVLPVNNLPVPSAPWGRAMEKRLRALEKRTTIDSQDIAGQNRNTAATLQGLSDQLAEMFDLFMGQTGFVADYVNVPGPYNISSTEDTTISSVSITVPDGFTTALVVGYGEMDAVAPSGDMSELAGRVYMRVNDGPDYWSALRFQSVAGGYSVAVYPFLQEVFTGLTGGDTITASLAASSWPDNWTNRPGGSTLSVQGYFSRVEAEQAPDPEGLVPQGKKIFSVTDRPPLRPPHRSAPESFSEPTQEEEI